MRKLGPDEHDLTPPEGQPDWLPSLAEATCLRCGDWFNVPLDEVAGYVCPGCQFDDWHDEELQEGSEPNEL